MLRVDALCLRANKSLLKLGARLTRKRLNLSLGLGLSSEAITPWEPTGSHFFLDSTTIDLCLGLFDWAPFRSAKAAVKMHTLLDLRGSIPAFIHISDGKMHDVHVLDMLPIEAGAFYIMDRGAIWISLACTPCTSARPSS